MKMIIIHDVNLLKGIPDWMLKEAWEDCIHMVKNLALTGKPNDIFLDNLESFPIDDLVSYALRIDAEMNKRRIGHSIGCFNYWLFPTNKHNARWRLTYKNCKRYGLKRLDKHAYCIVNQPFADLYGFGCIFNDVAEYAFMSRMFVDGAVSEEEFSHFCAVYERYKGR